MKILVTGARGQVGHELLRALAPLGEVRATTRDGKLDSSTPCLALDLADPAAIASTLAHAAPEVIVNAAAYTAVDRAEDEPEQARRINAEAVAALAAWAARHEVPVVHYSTDYVFPGHGDRPLRETDITGPVSVYGSSKLTGEQALAASGAEYLVLRTAWVYAARGHNFLRTMLRLGAERERLTVVDDQHGTPTSARLIADVTAQILGRWLASDAQTRRARSGIYHLVASGQTTWCGFARAIMRQAVAHGLLEHAPEVDAVGSDTFPTRAARPAWSVLDTGHIRDTFGVTLPEWQDELETVIEELARQAGRPS